jgi:hypothetical protein
MSFPSFCKDKEFRSLITLLLNKNPLQRMIKLAQIKKNVWYSDFNWENLVNLNFEPPHIPKVSQEQDSKTQPFITFAKVKIFLNFRKIIKNGNHQKY